MSSIEPTSTYLGDPMMLDVRSAPTPPGDAAAVATLFGAGADGGGAARPPLDRDAMVTRYAHLVKYVVGRLGVSVPGIFDHEDAMQAGVLGLLRAIDAYRPDSVASFESYAIVRIRGSILDAVRSLDTIGRAGREAGRSIQAAVVDLQADLGRAPEEAEVADRLGLTVERYRERLQAATVVTISLDEADARDDDDDGGSLAETAVDPSAVDPLDAAARTDELRTLAHEIERLSDRQKLVLALYYQDELTFKEIGRVLGVTESRVCQIHTEAVLGLRSRLVEPDVVRRLGRRRPTGAGSRPANPGPRKGRAGSSPGGPGSAPSGTGSAYAPGLPLGGGFRQ